MKLHLEKKDFNDAIQATAIALRIPDIFIEKDYWVTYILKNLSESDFKDQVVFKGGTSLSKAHKILDRFSEDIDLAILDKEKNSANQIKNLLKKIEKSIILSPLEENKDFQSSKGSRFRKTGHTYPKILKEYNFQHAVETLILEINAFASPTPAKSLPIESYITTFLRTQNPKLITEFSLESFNVLVLDHKRTFAEKIMGLARISIHDDAEYTELGKKIRHFYDIHKIMQMDDIKSFIQSGELEKTLKLVLENDLMNPEFKQDWKLSNLKEAPLFKDQINILKKLDPIFSGNFQSLLFRSGTTNFSTISTSFSTLSTKIPNIKI